MIFPFETTWVKFQFNDTFFNLLVIYSVTRREFDIKLVVRYGPRSNTRHQTIYRAPHFLDLDPRSLNVLAFWKTLSRLAILIYRHSVFLAEFEFSLFADLVPDK